MCRRKGGETKGESAVDGGNKDRPGRRRRSYPPLFRPFPPGAASPETKQTLVLGGLFGAWYLFNIYFNM